MHLCCVYLCCQTVLKLYQPLHALTISSAIRHDLTYKQKSKITAIHSFCINDAGTLGRLSPKQMNWPVSQTQK